MVDILSEKDGAVKEQESGKQDRGSFLLYWVKTALYSVCLQKKIHTPPVFKNYPQYL